MYRILQISSLNQISDMLVFVFCLQCFLWLPSVLWCCWLGGRKGIRPVKTEWGTSVWSKVQIICIRSSWCHCHPIISCSSKIQNDLPFWCQLTQVVLENNHYMDAVAVVVLQWDNITFYRICWLWYLWWVWEYCSSTSVSNVCINWSLRLLAILQK